MTFTKYYICDISCILFKSPRWTAVVWYYIFPNTLVILNVCMYNQEILVHCNCHCLKYLSIYKYIVRVFFTAFKIILKCKGNNGLYILTQCLQIFQLYTLVSNSTVEKARFNPHREGHCHKNCNITKTYLLCHCQIPSKVLSLLHLC